MKINFVLALLLANTVAVNAQKPLSIGDKMPSWKFTPLLNGTGPIQLDSYKNKSTMIEFWSSMCGGCLNMMVRADAYKKKFGNDFNALFINEDKDPDRAVKLLEKRKDLRDLALPWTKPDSNFSKLFPHNGDPHIVLVGKDGRVKAITAGGYINEKVIGDLVNGKEIRLPLQRPNLSLDDQNSLFTDGFLTSSALLYNSVLTRYVDGLSESFYLAKDLPGGRARYAMTNASIFDLYLQAYSSDLLSNNAPLSKTVTINVRDKKQLGIGIEDKLDNSYKYCYELIMPRNNNKNNAFLVEYMKKDLDRYFNINASLENRSAKCYRVVPVTATPSQMKDKNDQFEQEWPDKIEFHNSTVSAINGMLNNVFDNEIFLWSSTDPTKYNLVLKSHYDSIEDLKKDLNSKGFDLLSEQKQLVFLVLNDK